MKIELRVFKIVSKVTPVSAKTAIHILAFPKTLSIVELRSMMKRLGKQVLFRSLNKMRKTILQMIIFFGSNSKTGII